MQHAYLRSLTAKWLSRTRSDSPSTVLSLMQARHGRERSGQLKAPYVSPLPVAAQFVLHVWACVCAPSTDADALAPLPFLCVQEAAEQALVVGAASPAEQRGTACRVLYRLAHYADGLYRNIEAQKASPEYKTQQAVIGAKRRQVGWVPGEWGSGSGGGCEEFCMPRLLHMSCLHMPCPSHVPPPASPSHWTTVHMRIATHNPHPPHSLLQLDELEARLVERKRRGESRIDKKSGQFLDEESRVLAHMILTTRRPVDMDEAEQQVRKGGGWVGGWGGWVGGVGGGGGGGLRGKEGRHVGIPGIGQEMG